MQGSSSSRYHPSWAHVADIMTKPKGPADYYRHLRPPLYGKYPTNPLVRGSCRTESPNSPSSGSESVTSDSSVFSDLTKTTSGYSTKEKATTVAQSGLNVSLTGNGGLTVGYTPTSGSMPPPLQDPGVTEGLNDAILPPVGV